MEKKKLLFYEKNKFAEFINQLPRGKDNVYPISYLTDKNITLKYTSINGVEHIIIDITAMVMSALARSDLQILYEGWISSLNEKNEENIEYCVEKTFLHKACDLFNFYFETDEEMPEVIEEIRENTNVEIEKNSIVYYKKEQFDLIMEKINTQLYGHVAFKSNLEERLKAFILLHRMERKKVFSMLLCGKSGVGKTEVGRILQREMYPKESPIKINFGNYSGKGSLWSLIGSPKGYVGSEKGGELTNKIIHSKSKIIVFDELDKADEAIFTFFYEMLEDGQYTDLDGKVIDLDGYIIIFTANLNNSNFQDLIPEPLFSRFDMTYEFQPLLYEEKLSFISDFTDKLIKDYVEHIGELDKTYIKNKILELNYQRNDNLRIIKRNVMNAFVELVGETNVFENSNED